MSEVLDRIYLLKEQIEHLEERGRHLQKQLRDSTDEWRSNLKKRTEERDTALRQHMALKLALRRIAESLITWKDEEADSLLEKIGMVANEAINRDEEGFYR